MLLCLTVSWNKYVYLYTPCIVYVWEELLRLKKWKCAIRWILLLLSPPPCLLIKVLIVFFLKTDLMDPCNTSFEQKSVSPSLLCVCAERRAAAALKQEKPGGEGGPSESCFPSVMNRIGYMSDSNIDQLCWVWRLHCSITSKKDAGIVCGAFGSDKRFSEAEITLKHLRVEPRDTVVQS